ncbi:MAG TPA: polysaccharide biosynthesis protein, partial [Sediminibacterium sp.]
KYTGLRPGEKLYEELLMDSENTLQTYHEKIMIAKVRQPSSDGLKQEFSELIQLAHKKQNTLELVAKMKQLVPEFVSNNSIFESLDNKAENKVVPITKVM